MEAIPREMAWQLCQEIRADNRGKWYTFRGLWCWGCSTFGRGDSAKMCFANGGANRGCGQVNARYEALRELDPGREAVDLEPILLFGRRGPSGTASGWRKCQGCGRQFRASGSGGPEIEYCPTCDYRRARQRLDQQDRGQGVDSEAE